jgi:hypothetical protein
VELQARSMTAHFSEISTLRALASGPQALSRDGLQ